MSMPDFTVILLYFIHLLLSLSFHESAHAWTAYKLGDPTARYAGRITLNPIAHIDPIGTILFPLISLVAGARVLFGWAKPTPVDARYFRNPKRDQMITALAGPVSNLLLATGFALFFHLTIQFYAITTPGLRPSPLILALLAVFRTGVILNVVLAVFNLLPIFPLDGSWVAEGLMPHSWLPSWYRFKPYAPLVLLGMFLFPGLLGLFMYPPIRLLLALYRIPF